MSQNTAGLPAFVLVNGSVVYRLQSVLTRNRTDYIYLRYTHPQPPAPGQKPLRDKYAADRLPLHEIISTEEAHRRLKESEPPDSDDDAEPPPFGSTSQDILAGLKDGLLSGPVLFRHRDHPEVEMIALPVAHLQTVVREGVTEAVTEADALIRKQFAAALNDVREVLAYVSRGATHAFYAPYPDAKARRALATLDDLITPPQPAQPGGGED